jgi:hypothetical protein
VPLELDVPSDWLRHAGGAAAPGGGLVLEIDPLRAYADVDPFARMAHGSGEMKYVQTVDLLTITGWPMRVIHVLGMDGGEVIESRLGAFYRFVVYGGVVVARARDLARWESQRIAMLAMFRGARPRLRAERPAVLRDLFAL